MTEFHKMASSNDLIDLEAGLTTTLDKSKVNKLAIATSVNYY